MLKWRSALKRYGMASFRTEKKDGPSFKGKVHLNDRAEIHGWMVDLNHTDRRLDLILEVNGRPFAETRADTFRQDVKRRNIGDGCYGYRAKLPADLDSSGDMEILVYPAGHRDAALKKHVRNPDWSFQEAIRPAEELDRTRGEQRWRHFDVVGAEILASDRFEGVLRAAGRAALRGSDHAGALKLLKAADALYPDNAETRFHLGLAHSKSGDPAAADDVFRTVLGDKAFGPRAACHIAESIVRTLNQSGHDKDFALQTELAEIARLYLEAGEPKAIMPARVGNALSHAGYRELGLNIIENAIVREPDKAAGYVAKSRYLFEQSHVEAALELSAEILERWPDNQTAAFNLRVFGKLRGARPLDYPIAFARLVSLEDGDQIVCLGADDPALEMSTARHLDALDDHPADWLILGDIPADQGLEDLERLARASDNIGCVRVSADCAIWRREAVRNLAVTGLLMQEGEALGTGLHRYERFYVRKRPADMPRGAAILASRFGAIRFGGAEQFLATMANYYAAHGYSPFFVGTHRDYLGQEGELDGKAYTFVPHSWDALLRNCLLNDAEIVHALSGLGYDYAEALSYTNIAFVYGVHYWREVLGHSSGETYFTPEGEPIPRREFNFILAQATSVYVNSKYTQKIVESAHGIRCPLIYSVPGERTA